MTGEKTPMFEGAPLQASDLRFSEKSIKELEKIKGSYPSDEPRATIMPALWVAQEQFGWVSPQVMGMVAKEMNVPLI